MAAGWLSAGNRDGIGGGGYFLFLDKPCAQGRAGAADSQEPVGPPGRENAMPVPGACSLFQKPGV